ncbi:MAG: replicative DNA helicase [Gammaproteobacteria bacterium RIFCSPHIGHO2_12_FULL_45_9]|nr:MAG: replicative DNA helicase [Gammaproteobacteria bacterium RIFCSPHIGHO2_12_FULL_45_9]
MNDRLPVKVPPHSQEAEQSVLGALLLDARAWDRVADRLSSADFYRKDHQSIFAAMVHLVEQSRPIDVLTLTDALTQANQLANMGGEVYLYELVKNTPTAANIEAYADIVRERSVMRQLIETGGDIVSRVFQPDTSDVRELLDFAERRVFQIASQQTRGSGPVDFATLLAQAVNRVDMLYHNQAALTGLSTGFRDLDTMTTGLHPGDLVIVAGRPSMGKTTVAMNMAEAAAIGAHKAVLVFSMEMPGESLALRTLSSLSRLNQQRLRTGRLEEQDWEVITSTVGMVSSARLYVDDTPALTPMELRSRARRLAREHPDLSLIVIDYLQLMQVPGSRENRSTEISEISRSLKALAKELGVPVVALSQLNRSLEARTDKRPVMSDLRESGAIEQDADLILFVYRDEVYHDNTPDRGKAEIIIAKQRNGPIGKVMLKFHGEFTRFDDLSHEEIPAEFMQGVYV